LHEMLCQWPPRQAKRPGGDTTNSTCPCSDDGQLVMAAAVGTTAAIEYTLATSCDGADGVDDVAQLESAATVATQPRPTAPKGPFCTMDMFLACFLE
jgi:hypothetical protein